MCFGFGTRSRSSRKHTEEELPRDNFRDFIADDAAGIQQLTDNFLVPIPTGNNAHGRIREVSRVRIRAELEQLLNGCKVAGGSGEMQRRSVECIPMVHVADDGHSRDLRAIAR